jgi:biotin carboxylase
MKKILIMGAGIYQVPLIKKAKQLGHKVIVVSPEGNYPGLKLVDEIISLDTRDHLGVLEHAARIGIDAVLTTGTDVAVPTIGYLVDKLGLAGTGFEAAQRSMDKALMKQCFAEHGVQTAPFKVVETLEELTKEAIEMGFPVMVKAVDSSGSRGITQVLIREELEVAYISAKAVSKYNKVIVEKYLNGFEMGGQAVIVENDVVEVFLHSDEVTPPPISAPIGHAMPLSLKTELYSKIKELVKKAVQGLGIKSTISNIDIMVVDNEPYILEIGARMGATCLAENISIYAGFDAYEFIIKLALGMTPVLPENFTKQPNAALLLRVEKSGKIKNIAIPESTLQHPNLIDLSLDVGIGDEVKKFKVGPDRVGQVIVKADSYEAANDLVKQLASTVVIEVV